MTQQDVMRWRDYGQMVGASTFCWRCKKENRNFKYGREKYKDGRLQYLAVFECHDCGWRKYIYTDVAKDEREQMKKTFLTLMLDDSDDDNCRYELEIRRGDEGDN